MRFQNSAAIIPLYNTDTSVFITEEHRVNCEARTQFAYAISKHISKQSSRKNGKLKKNCHLLSGDP
jgi:hypothetical protein